MIIAHAFPPAGLVGALRPAKFAKYLTRCGWRVFAITTRKRPYGYDPFLLDDISDVHVVATTSIETFGLRTSLRTVLQRGGMWARVARVAWRVLDGIAIPDHAVGWAPFAYSAAVRAARRNPVAAVLATGNPFTTFLVGFAVSRRMRIPLILDYRDPWTLQAGFSPRPMNKRFSLWFDPKVVMHAAAILVVNEEMKKHIREAFGEAVADKVHVLPNGYDAEELPRWQPPIPATRLVLMHVGSFTSRRTPDPLWRLLALVPEEARPQLDVLLLGAEGVVVPPDLASIVRVLPRSPRKEALTLMGGAHVMLVVTGTYASEQTTKLPEYLGMEAPVLVLGQGESSAASIVAEYGAGVSATIEDLAPALEFLMSNLRRVQGGERPVPAYSRPGEYSREVQAKRLDKLLRQVTGQHSSPDAGTDRQSEAPGARRDEDSGETRAFSS